MLNDKDFLISIANLHIFFLNFYKIFAIILIIFLSDTHKRIKQGGQAHLHLPSDYCLTLLSRRGYSTRLSNERFAYLIASLDNVDARS